MPRDLANLKARIQLHHINLDGPVARVVQLSENPVFAKTMKAFLDGNLHPNKWQHSLREDYRLNAWQVLCRDRSQHFTGTWQGVDRARTLGWLNELMTRADELQAKCDQEDFIIEDPKADPRAQLKVLRLLLSAGLQNPERQHRHKKKAGKAICLCNGGEPSLEHISWHCPRFADIRQVALQNLPMPLSQLPQCFFILHHRPQHPDNHYPPGTKNPKSTGGNLAESH